MDNPIYDLIIELRTPERTERHITLHRIIEDARLDAALTDELLNLCTDPECLDCARIVCPYHEPLHFHHDGCPACSTGKHVEY